MVKDNKVREAAHHRKTRPPRPFARVDKCQPDNQLLFVAPKYTSSVGGPGDAQKLVVVRLQSLPQKEYPTVAE